MKNIQSHKKRTATDITLAYRGLDLSNVLTDFQPILHAVNKKLVLKFGTRQSQKLSWLIRPFEICGVNKEMSPKQIYTKLEEPNCNESYVDSIKNTPGCYHKMKNPDEYMVCSRNNFNALGNAFNTKRTIENYQLVIYFLTALQKINQFQPQIAGAVQPFIQIPGALDFIMVVFLTMLTQYFRLLKNNVHHETMLVSVGSALVDATAKYISRDFIMIYHLLCKLNMGITLILKHQKKITNFTGSSYPNVMKRLNDVQTFINPRRIAEYFEKEIQQGIANINAVNESSWFNESRDIAQNTLWTTLASQNVFWEAIEREIPFYLNQINTEIQQLLMP